MRRFKMVAGSKFHRIVFGLLGCLLFGALAVAELPDEVDLPPDASVTEGQSLDSAAACKDGCNKPVDGSPITQCKKCVVDFVYDLTREGGKVIP